ncbi:MAG: hypothetical protein ABJB66_09150 [Gemmatimonadaceae bacterium]
MSKSSTGVVTPEQALRRLYLTLFLRGRSARGIKLGSSPTSIGRKLATVLSFYALFGLFSLSFIHQKVFLVATFAHAMTFVFLGLFVATTAGEVLFNKEEGDILLHRPIQPRVLLWAKVSVIVRVSLWLAGAFNLVAFLVGATASDGSWMFVPAHALSTALEALFTASTVVLVYQLCLRWLGREKLDTFMTATQVIGSVLLVLSGQLVPQLMIRNTGTSFVSVNHWWIGFLPPAWFAGFDDALAGSHAMASWGLAILGLAVTGVVVWLAFTQLADSYQSGLQSVAESSTSKPSRTRRNSIVALTRIPPLSWWLRDSVSRASFVLTAAYLLRDRDVKLRVYPGLAPMLIMPVITMLPGRNGGMSTGAFGVAFAGCYVGLVPLLALGMLEFSQQWQASDVFRLAPMKGPAPLAHGARRAVLFLLAFPLLCVFAAMALAFGRNASELILLLPGIIALPIFAMIPCLNGGGIPFSRPTDEGKAAGRNFKSIGVMFSSAILAGIAAFAYKASWFNFFLAGEATVVAVAYFAMRASVTNAHWKPIE